MQQILFAPVAIVSGLIAGLVSKKSFELVWSRVSDDDPPDPGARDASWGLLITALVAQGAIVAVVRGLVDRGARIWFLRMTGAWPGEKEDEKA